MTNVIPTKSIEFIKQNKEQPFSYFSHITYLIPIYLSLDYQDKYDDPYANAVSEIDDSVGKILDTHSKHFRLKKKTLVIFHIGQWTIRYLMIKVALHFHSKVLNFLLVKEGKVPTIFWWPDTINKGTIKELGSTLDFFNTFITLSGIKTQSSHAKDSFDLSPVLFNQSSSPRSDFFLFQFFCST